MTVAKGFEPVEAAFRDLVSSGAESGAGLAVIRDGRAVVDLVGGVVRRDTLVNTYSVSKPFAAYCLLLLIERGRADLDDPVRRHWREFESDATLRHVLAHTAGLPVFPVTRTAKALRDWDLLCADLATATPMWTSGEVAAEHALTYGHLVGEIVRRIDGRSLGRFLREEVAEPWELDLGFGLSPADQARCADLVYGDPDWPVTILGEPGSLKARALGNPLSCLDVAVLNGELWRGSEVPAVNLHATALGVARFYAELMSSRQEIVAEAVRVQHDGVDRVLDRTVRWGLGVQVDDDGSWGMGGIGGNCGFADPVRGYAFGYVTRHLAGFDRVDRLVDVLNECL
ncbi:MAG: beta-lactamase family protein [Hamadaea sp.]|uniref:serine hydrolase domain-containing protein n=1 Tax=Hamadaea sp. TaxID=2024425 RepID=UPI00184E8224|nr:serine hydrolase domain-containing protein [Hamadaea sp.]NUR73918.1 beta-lactamase family protein [Hamadaea sp.]NUT19607.1 beta-lactamase family protein [Hamadaea sp.]